MAKKRVTLPKDFDELLKVGDIEVLKAVYDKCELTAYDGKFGLHTALHYKGVPDELVIWLVKQGLDVNIYLTIMAAHLCTVRQPLAWIQ